MTTITRISYLVLALTLFLVGALRAYRCSPFSVLFSRIETRPAVPNLEAASDQSL